MGGDGDPIVLIHGGWEDARAWEALLPILATGFDVLVLDRPGHGAAGPDEGMGPAETAEQVAALLERAGHFPAHLAAQDTGAEVAARVAIDRPELVRSLVLHEPVDLALAASGGVAPADREEARSILTEAVQLALDGKLEHAARAYLRGFGSVREAWELFPAAARARWLGNGPRWAQETARSLENPRTADVAPALSDGALPVLVSVGAESPLRTRRLVDSWARAVSNSRVELLPEAGHLPYLFAPATLVGAWAQFLLERHVPPT